MIHNSDGLGLLAVKPDYQDYLPAPESKPEVILDSLWVMAKELWPEDTAKAEAWVKEQAVRYGVAEAKAQAATVAQSPLTWLVIGGAIWFLFLRR